jgi:hypothetical protein
LKILKKTIVFEKSDVLFRSVQFVLKAQRRPAEKPRPALDGAVIENEGDRQVLAASDGNRLHVCELGKAGVFPCGRFSIAMEKSAITLSLGEWAHAYALWRNVVPKEVLKLCGMDVDKKRLHEALWRLYSIGVPIRIEHLMDLAGYGYWEVWQKVLHKQASLVFKQRAHGLLAVIQPPVMAGYAYPPIEEAEALGGLFQ